MIKINLKSYWRIKMAENDLCTFEDLVDEDDRVEVYEDDTSKMEKIAKKITKISALIKSPPRDPELTSDNIYANMCCIYGVLAWMEKAKTFKEIETSKDVQSWTEGDRSRTYVKSTASTSQEADLSYDELYQKYLTLLSPGNDQLEIASTPYG